MTDSFSIVDARSQPGFRNFLIVKLNANRRCGIQYHGAEARAHVTMLSGRGHPLLVIHSFTHVFITTFNLVCNKYFQQEYDILVSYSVVSLHEDKFEIRCAMPLASALTL